MTLYLRGSPSMVDLKRDEPAITVDIRPLDTVLADHGLEHVRMIKIDVEGFEPDVLAGAPRLLASKVPPIVCFEHGVYPSQRDIFGLLQSASSQRYAFFQPVGTKKRHSRLVQLHDPQRARQHDNVFAIPKDVVGELPRTLF